MFEMPMQMVKQPSTLMEEDIAQNQQNIKYENSKDSCQDDEYSESISTSGLMNSKSHLSEKML